MAPKAMSSPWAKLVRPVVPKISDSPTAASAITRPKRTPLANRLASRSTSDGPAVAVWPDSVRRNTTGSTPLDWTFGLSVARAPSSSSIPSGSESVSITTW